MKAKTLRALLWGGLVLVGLTAGCQGLRTGGGKLGKGGASREFLESDYAPLQAWLDETFEVEYRKMTLDIVFEQQPISDIRYEFRNIAKSSPLFSLKSQNISRRDILRQIAAFYGLEMSIAEINGKPAYVVVVGKASRSEFDPNETGVSAGRVLEL